MADEHTGAEVFGLAAERLQRLKLLVDGSEPNEVLTAKQPDVLALVDAAGEAARAARDLLELANARGYHASDVVTSQAAHLLPLNRKERFYTATVLPVIVAHDGFAHLDRFLKLCGIDDVNTSSRRDGTAPCQLTTEYNFAESLIGADDARWNVQPRTGDTPDIVLAGEDWLIVVEGKMFHRPTRAQLDAQLARQRPLIDEWAHVLGVAPARVRHVAVIPEQLADEIAPLTSCDDVVTWQTIIDNYCVVGPPYWVGVLEVACSRWNKLAARPPKFTKNAHAILTGAQIVALAHGDVVEYAYVGRAGGAKADGKLADDIARGTWRDQPYQVRRDPPTGSSRNWLPIDDFVALVTANGPS
jgi:hypothetical protein